jgi:hypothetical protein
MTQAILADAEARPELFIWNGPIESPVLERWLASSSLAVPRDLFLFWAATGGGDLFETETILGPFGNPGTGDDVIGANLVYRQNGLSADSLVFHVGMCVSAARPDGVYVTLDAATFAPTATYGSLEQWYVAAIRSEYAARYGLLSIS